MNKRLKAGLAIGGVAAAALVTAAGIANAASPSPSPSSSTSGSASANGTAPSTPAGDPATVAHGPDETLLTGTTADKVRAAALAAVPGATVIRVETDSGAAEYEAHLKKADGTYVTVKLDASFKVTGTEQGFGAGPGGGHGGPGDNDGDGPGQTSG